MRNFAQRFGKRDISLFAASGFYLLAAFGLQLFGVLSWPLSRLLYGLRPEISPEGLELILSVLYYGVFIFLPVLIWVARRPGRIAPMRLNPVSAGTAVRIAALTAVMVFLLNDLQIFWGMLFEGMGLNVSAGGVNVPGDTCGLTLMILSGSFIAVVAEELLFRGVLFPAWETAGGAGRAVWVSAVWFAVMHGSVIGFPAQLCCGIVVALLVLWTDSLYAGMIYHGMYNAIVLILAYISAGVKDPATARYGLYAAVGGGFGVLVLAMECAVGVCVAVWLLRGLKPRSDDRGIPAAGKGLGLLALAGVAAAAPLYVRDILMMMGVGV